MPMIDVFVPQGALPDAMLAALAGDIAQAALREEGYAGSRFAASVTWTYVHEMPAGRLLVGAGPCTSPVWRVEVASPAGSLTPRAKARLADEVAGLVQAASRDAEDRTPAGRVWCLFHDIAEGEWFAGGRAASAAAIRAAVARERGEAAAPAPAGKRAAP